MKWYKRINGGGVTSRILRKIIAGHKLMECFVWINRRVFSEKYSHMYMLLKKAEGIE